MALTEPQPHLDADSAPPHCEVAPEEMLARADDASTLLKALAHEGRLMILCHLSRGEKTVTELEILLSSRQAAISQQLARLRLEGLVSARRDGKAIFYSVADTRAERLISVLYDIFCKNDAPAD